MILIIGAFLVISRLLNLLLLLLLQLRLLHCLSLLKKFVGCFCAIDLLHLFFFCFVIIVGPALLSGSHHFLLLFFSFFFFSFLSLLLWSQDRLLHLLLLCLLMIEITSVLLLLIVLRLLLLLRDPRSIPVELLMNIHLINFESRHYARACVCGYALYCLIVILSRFEIAAKRLIFGGLFQIASHRLLCLVTLFKAALKCLIIVIRVIRSSSVIGLLLLLR